MSSGGTEFLDRAGDSSPTEALRNLITAPLLAAAAGISGLVYSVIGSIANITDVIGAGWTFLVALITEPIIILERGAEFTAAATADFGIFAFAVGIGGIIAGFWLWEASGIGIPIVDQLIPWR